MAKLRHRRAAEEKCTAAWAREVEAELFSYPNGRRTQSSRHRTNSVRRGRWDPFDRFRNKEDLTKFYSGFDYRRYQLRDREQFARFVIQQVLKDHPDDEYNVTGEIMKNEPLVNQSHSPEASDDLVSRAIRADVQQDVDAELPGDLASRASKSCENEVTQTIGAAAKSFIAAGSNSLGPPLDPCVRYLSMTKCAGGYGRNNSTVWKSPFIPKLDNEDGRRGLLDHQVTGIVWLLSRLFGTLPILKYKDQTTGRHHSTVETLADKEDRDRLKGPKYFGGILADSMGLGKTLITVALVDLLIRQGLNVVHAKNGSSKHRPILLLTPNAAVANQWVEEFSQVIDESILRHIVVSGPGLELPSNPARVIHIDSESFKKWPKHLRYMWDEKDPRASRIVLIMTMETWALRTCTYDDGQTQWRSSLTNEGRGFSLVIVDEAYKVKNHRTKNWQSVYLLERQFTLLITATPCMNTLADLFGLAWLLWTAPEKYLKQDEETWAEIDERFQFPEDLEILDEYPPSHDFWLIAGRVSLLTKLLHKPKDSLMQDADLTRKYLKYFEMVAMLRRSPSSYLYADWQKTKPISLDGLYPKVENYTVDISVDEAYDGEYQTVHTELLIKYLEGLNAWGSAMASSSLDVYDLDTIITANGYSTRAEKIAEMREKDVDLLRLAQFLVLPTETEPETHVDWSKLSTRKSPILRYILDYIEKNILTRQGDEPIKKLLIIEQNLMVALYYERFLQFLGTKLSSCQILIQLYTVGFAGINLHKSCSQVIIASQSHSLQVQSQATHRVIRVGQNSDVTVHRVKLKNSYHSFRESRQIEKILPELGARAHGDTKRGLIRLLNMFQYEVQQSWHSPEGQKLRRERNLLEDEEEYSQEPDAFSSKRVKLNNGSKVRVKLEHKEIKTESETTEVEDWKIKVKDRKVKIKHEDISDSPAATSNKRKQTAIAFKSGDGSGGWYNKSDGLKNTAAFLKLRTREQYYQEFISLPRDAKSQFSHAKNNLRRLLSYGYYKGVLSTAPWTEADLTEPAILERALELMLRVRLGARDITMLPLPMIDLAKAPAAHRVRLQRLLADTQHTDQDLERVGSSGAGKNAANELWEALRRRGANKPLAKIDQGLEEQAKMGDAVERKKKAKTHIIDLTNDAKDDDIYEKPEKRDEIVMRS
ncbi:hypothetical protein ONZ43_g5926 [Nemania bipapillata]|uniref:Uncharacterized protein n=1 Tax=Nemania bipapillata TaxID=110536 RepID=A0ACC2I4Y9_9PEZI|nr:hypothetical protein ONZ43_g5926 [Nemania bipapillata]